MLHPVEVSYARTHLDTAEVLGYPICLGSRGEIVELLWQRLCEGTTTHVVTLNSEMVITARRNPSMRRLLLQADVYVADSVGLVWAAGVLRRPGIERCPGIDLALDLLQRLAGARGRVYLLGSRPGIAERAAMRLVEQLPGLVVAGTHHGYFHGNGEEEVVARISAARPDLLLVGMGSPRQEALIVRRRADLNVPLMVGVGGALEVFAGVRRRAPRWVRGTGLEWAYRTMTDVSRFKRLGALPHFILAVFRESRGGAG